MPPIIETDALRNKGIDVLHAAINDHLTFVKEQNGFLGRREERMHKEVVKQVEDAVRTRLRKFLEDDGDMETVIKDIINGQEDPYSGAEMLVKRFFFSQGS